jgi:hypothetical protein
MSPTDNIRETDLRSVLDAVTRKGLSLRARVAHLALLLGSSAMAIVLTSLLATEPGLPSRTLWSFVLMLLISLCWVAYAVWALHTRITLLAQHRIIAGRLAVAFSTIFVVSAVAAAIHGVPAAALAAVFGAIGLAGALLLLRKAQQHRVDLLQRRDELQRQLTQGLPG